MGVATKTRADGQLSSLAGEFFVAAELLKRDFQTSVTFGNVKAIDLPCSQSGNQLHLQGPSKSVAQDE